MSYITRQDDISILPLSVRSLNCLRRADIHTVGAMVDYPSDELINIRSMGKKSVEEIQTVIRFLNDGFGEYVLVDANEIINSKNIITQGVVSNDGSVTVVLNETGEVIQDVAVNDLQLSVRAKHSLIYNGYKYASQLVGITYKKLMNLRSTGTKTAEEILTYIEKISISRSTCAEASEADNSGNDLTSELCTAYGEAESTWIRELLTIKAQFPEAMGETLIYRLYDSVFVRGIVKATILQMVEENGGEISKAALEEKMPQHLNNTTILDEILLELENVSAIEMGEVMIERQYPSIVDFIAQIEDDRVREIIKGRVEGKTLQEIGEQYNVTRERARQLMQRGLRKSPA